MKTFSQFVAEAYDADLMKSASIRKTGEGGRVGAERKKTAPEMRRMKQAKAGETRQPSVYKSRTDIGKQRGSQTAEPTQERGSAASAQLAAAKAERKKAALARLAAKKGGEASTPAAKSKPKASELSAQARKLTAKKAAEVDKRPADQPKRAVVGMSRAQRKDITRRGHRFAQELARQGEAERRGIPPSKVKLTKLTDAK